MSSPKEIEEQSSGYRGRAISLYPKNSIPTQQPGETVAQVKVRAVRLGSKVYRGRKPHKECGGNIRYVFGGGCVECIRAYARARYQEQRTILLAEALKAEANK